MDAKNTYYYVQKSVLEFSLYKNYSIMWSPMRSKLAKANEEDCSHHISDFWHNLIDDCKCILVV